MPYAKYSSHSTNQYNDAAKMTKAKLIWNPKDCAKAQNSWKKKEQKAMSKELKVLKKRNKQLMKMMVKKATSKKKEKFNIHNILMKKT